MNDKYISGYHNDTITHVLEPVYISVGTQYRNLYQLSVKRKRVTYFTLRADTGNDVGHS